MMCEANSRIKFISFPRGKEFGGRNEPGIVKQKGTTEMDQENSYSYLPKWKMPGSPSLCGTPGVFCTGMYRALFYSPFSQVLLLSLMRNHMSLSSALLLGFESVINKIKMVEDGGLMSRGYVCILGFERHVPSSWGAVIYYWVCCQMGVNRLWGPWDAVRLQILMKWWSEGPPSPQ